VDAPLLLAVDGNSLVHRSFHAWSGGAVEQPAWAVRGLLTQLVAAVDRVRPTAVVIGFDDATRSWRRERWPQYKATRAEKLPALVEQLDLAVAAVRALGVAVVVPAGLEADDVLASAAAHARDLGGTSVIVTSDRDAFSLIDSHTSVLRIINGGVDASPLLTPERLVTLLGVRPGQYRDYAALRGDPSDNLPGVTGIGPKTAARLLAIFGTAAAAFADPAAVERELGAGVARRLAAGDARTNWTLNCEVMAQRCDLDLDLRTNPGALPLAPDAVADVFGAHNLTWTTAQALRVLAGVETDERPPRPVPAWDPGHGRTWPRTTTPKPTAAPVNPQLALF